jgi:hypothetical protein
MTAHELRKHLVDQHGIFLWGAAYDHLLRRHEQDHISGADHQHDHDREGDG